MTGTHLILSDIIVHWLQFHNNTVRSGNSHLMLVADVQVGKHSMSVSCQRSLLSWFMAVEIRLTVDLSWWWCTNAWVRSILDCSFTSSIMMTNQISWHQASVSQANHMCVDIYWFPLNDCKDTDIFTMYCNDVDFQWNDCWFTQNFRKRCKYGKSTVLSYRMSIPYPLVKRTAG